MDRRIRAGGVAMIASAAPVGSAPARAFRKAHHPFMLRTAPDLAAMPKRGPAPEPPHDAGHATPLTEIAIQTGIEHLLTQRPDSLWRAGQGTTP